MLYSKRIAAVELRHLRYFVALAEEGSVTKAAERLGIQQPPLSQQLRALEEEIGTTLFKRSSRGVQLTPAGRKLLDGARQLLALFNQTLEDTRRCGRGESQRVVIGYTNSGGFNDFVPRAIAAFRQRYPEVSVVLEECCTSELIDALRAEKVDIAFIRAPLSNVSGISLEPLVVEAMVVAVPGTHWLARRKDNSPVSLKALANETFLLYRRASPGLYDVIGQACARAGYEPRIGQEVPRMIGALNLVAAGFGITLVPASMQRLDTQSVSYIPLASDVEISAPIHLAWRTGELPDGARLFSTLVMNVARNTANGVSAGPASSSLIARAARAAASGA